MSKTGNQDAVLEACDRDTQVARELKMNECLLETGHFGETMDCNLFLFVIFVIYYNKS